MAKGPRILVLDIETAPNEGYFWGLWGQNIPIQMIKHPGYMLCWAAKWYGEREVMYDALINYPGKFKKNPRDESKIAQSIWKLLDEADIAITHHGDNFDLKWLNAVFLRNELAPPSTFKSIDTKKQSSRAFKFVSNKLDFLLQTLGIGHKMKHEGFSLWTKCMAGNEKAWDRMIKYNKKDVTELEKLYNEIRPFMKTHPNLALYFDDADFICTTCGSRDLQKKGYAYTQTSKFQRYKCMDCGKNVRGKTNMLSKSKKERTVR